MDNRSCPMNPYWDGKQLIPRDSCPVCNEPASSGIPTVRRLDNLMLKRCANCEGLFVDPCPSEADLLRLYDSDYFGSSTSIKRIGPGGDYCAISEGEIANGSIVGHTEIA